MGILVVLVIVLILVVAYGNQQQKVQQYDVMAKYSKMSLKEYWKSVEQDLLKDPSVYQGKKPWHPMHFWWWKEPKRLVRMNLYSVRANAERVSLDMDLDEYAVYFFKRFYEERGRKCYLDRKERHDFWDTYECVVLLDEHCNEHVYRCKKDMRVLGYGKFCNYFQIYESVFHDGESTIRELFSVPLE